MKVSMLHTAGDAPVRNRERVRAPGGLSKRRGNLSSSWHVTLAGSRSGTAYALKTRVTECVTRPTPNPSSSFSRTVRAPSSSVLRRRPFPGFDRATSATLRVVRQYERRVRAGGVAWRPR